MKIGFSNICTAAEEKCIGSKIISMDFNYFLEQALSGFVFPENGQAKIDLNEALHAVSCGIARRQDVPFGGYHIVEYREGPSLFADRKYAAPTENLEVIVYNQKAYTTDPDCDAKEVERCKDCDFVVVAVLASAGPKPPLSAYRFVHNLAGGNNAFKPENGYTLDQAIKQAREIVAYGKDWVTVADRVLL